MRWVYKYPWLKKALVGFLLVFAVVGMVWKNQNQNIFIGGSVKGYWIWAGISIADAPDLKSPLYIYQGVVKEQGGISTYSRKGVFPHPLKGRDIYLTLRLEGALPDPQALNRLFLSLIDYWQGRGVTIAGVQLDYDSPTAKLMDYSHFLTRFRHRFPKQYRLSVTGLGDWIIHGDRRALDLISSQTDEIIFQLYQGRTPLVDMEYFINGLAAIHIPFKVGLLDRPENGQYIATLRKNPYFGGVILFMQR